MSSRDVARTVVQAGQHATAWSPSAQGTRCRGQGNPYRPIAAAKNRSTTSSFRVRAIAGSAFSNKRPYGLSASRVSQPRVADHQHPAIGLGTNQPPGTLLQADRRVRQL